MEQPLVSVIVPVYNCEKYIKRCLDSILYQTYDNIELIVINDGSTDASMQIIQETANVWPDKLIIYTIQNSGVSIARNLGVQKAAGKYLTFVDGDDYLGKKYIESFVTAAEQNNSELCLCGYTMVNEAGCELYRLEPTAYIKGRHEEFAYRILAILGRFYRTSLWRKWEIQYDKNRNNRGEDIPVALFTNALAKNIITVQQCDYFYVQHTASARHQMRGLKTYDLPLQVIQDCIQTVSENSTETTWQFFELGVCRVFTTFLFDLGRGATYEKLNKLVLFEEDILRKYCRDYRKNRYLKLHSGLTIPIQQKMAVGIFIFLYRCQLLRAVVYLLGQK